MNEAAVVFVRGIIAFFTLLIFARLLGKQQVSELTFFDYILGITIGSIAATLTTDLSSRAWPHWVGLATWTAAVWFSSGSPYAPGGGQIYQRRTRYFNYERTDYGEKFKKDAVYPG